MEISVYLFVLLISLFYIPRPTSASCLGCVDLDVITFYKLLPRFPNALIKFDIAFPYGEKHEAFGQFSLKAHQMTNDLLVGLVGIKDYGEKENSELGEKFNVDPEAYPGIYLFRGGVNDYVRFPAEKDITVENLKEFVTENSNLYLGLEGCLKEFNELTLGYPDRNNDEQLELIEKASGLANTLKDDAQRASAKFYITFMKKVNEKGNEFLKEEAARLTKLKGGKISDSKKTELGYKLNILKSFKGKGGGMRSEL